MSEPERDTSRTVVQTYVPAYQRDAWDEHADQLGMSRSEFVKAMVQAGRRGFGAEVDAGPGNDGERRAENSLSDQVRTELSEGPLSWEELLAAVTGDIESRLEETLEALQRADEVRYSGPQGGYVLAEEKG